MVSSIRMKQIEQLVAKKKIDRAREVEEFIKAEAEKIAKKKASDERIAKKMAIIEAGGVVPNPEPPVVEVEAKPAEEKPVEKKVAKKKVTKKKAAKKKVAKKKVTKKKVAKKK
jgi:hypothetical protein|tara:strand:- start:5606 stop:5944 length:339 start_codon:yes stop_codon:yes gene_type:complete